MLLWGCFWKVPRLRLFDLMARATSTFVGMVLTEDNRNTRTQTCPNYSLPITNLTRADLLPNPDLRFERPATAAWAIARVPSLFNFYLNYTGCPRRNVPDFWRVFLMLKYTDITQNTYVQSWTVTELMAREVWNFDSCYPLIDYQIHIKTGRNMWFLWC